MKDIQKVLDELDKMETQWRQDIKLYTKAGHYGLAHEYKIKADLTKNIIGIINKELKL